MRFVLRLMLTAIAVTSPAGVRRNVAEMPAQAVQGSQAASSLLPEVRLRRLHLMRPDLIFYPVEVDVYC